MILYIADEVHYITLCEHYLQIKATKNSTDWLYSLICEYVPIIFIERQQGRAQKIDFIGKYPL